MAFWEKTVVLKQVDNLSSVTGRTASGIARIENDEGVCTFFLSLVNLKALTGSGEYFAFVKDFSGKVTGLSLGKRPCSFSRVIDEPPVNGEGFSCAVAVVSEDIPTVVLYQRTDGFNDNLLSVKKSVAEYCLLKRKERAKELPERPSAKEKSEELKIKTPSRKKEPPITAEDNFSTEKPLNNREIHEEFSAYDDEAVATENFYSLDEKIQEKVKLIGAMDNESLRNENGESDCFHQEKTQEIQNESHCDKIEVCDFNGEDDGDTSDEEWEKQPFFLREKEELEELFEKFPEEENLGKLFPDSKWVKINYSENKFYVVGLVKEENKEKYICYGVPGTYSESAPPELDGYCSFVPLSFFDMKGDGYWMMFQDAYSGECVHLNKHNVFKK